MFTYREFILNRLNNSTQYFDIWWIAELVKHKKDIIISEFQTANQLLNLVNNDDVVKESAMSYIDYLYYNQ